MSARAYFDWNATASLRPEARGAMLAALDLTGAASSVHSEGRAARALVEKARAHVAALVGGEAKSVIFTSGATEANMLALTPHLVVLGKQVTCDRLIVSAIEHASVLSGGRFPVEAVERLPVTAEGVVDLVALRGLLTKGGRPLVSVMHANNETGVIQPIAEIAALVHEAGGILHVDAVQTAGRIDCDIATLGTDMLTISSHKIGGPQGAGALVLNGPQPATPLIKGGGQERGFRAGTENVAAIAGFGAAAAAATAGYQVDAQRMSALRDRFETQLTRATPDAVVFGAEVPRLPNTTYFSAAGLKAETAVISFDLNGVAVSSGSACSSGKVTQSHVLTAMAADPALAAGALRVSIGWTTTEADVEILLNAWKKVSASLTKRHAHAA
ncbi:cysteine desulfurase family protein [Undibacter mobilis]|uniref:Cysteine desulfurase n=1 Tax=Undibacter mobilis TaxID=2292256 RepID=A0A371BDA4_9BRAD|nr:cysteine desulfurase family protein [Undibacter mobilis]RDV05572.1 cysteine desulfurase [Undibacter mobilis]